MYSNEGTGGGGELRVDTPPLELALVSIIDSLVLWSLLYIKQEYEYSYYISVGWNKAKGISGKLYAAVVLPGGWHWLTYQLLNNT